MNSEVNWRENSKKTEKAWKKFLKAAVKGAAPFIGMAVGAITENPKVAQATGNFQKSISGGKTLSLTDQRGNELRIKIMWFPFIWTLFKKI